MTLFVAVFMALTYLAAAVNGKPTVLRETQKREISTTDDGYLQSVQSHSSLKCGRRCSVLGVCLSASFNRATSECRLSSHWYEDPDDQTDPDPDSDFMQKIFFCLNGGTLQNDKYCSCPSGFTGDHCRTVHPSTTHPQTTTPDLTECNTTIPDQPAQDCKTLLDSGYTASGMYTIQLNDTQLNVFCDQTTAGGGWTVVQQRSTGSVSFYRSWSDYATGFGDTCNGNYWLGLGWIHKLIINKQSELYIKLTTPLGQKYFARYSAFSVGNASTYFTLNVGGYSGTAGDSLAYHNGMKFTTLDSDNDMSGGNCAIFQEGGWWYNNCLDSNLNGRYLNITDGDWVANLGMIWNKDLSVASMMETTMLVREV